MQSQMQQQASQKSTHCSPLLSLLETTYKQNSTSKIMAAQANLLSILDSNPASVEQLLAYIQLLDADANLRKACSNLLKKYYYQISQKPSIPKQKYLKLAYEILVNSKIQDSAVKQNIGIAVENILNHDYEGRDRDKWVEYTKMQIYALVENGHAWTLPTIEVLHGILLLIGAVFNSFVEPQDKIGFINMLLPALTKSAMLCSQLTRDNLQENTNLKHIFTPQLQLFELLQHIIETLLQEELVIPQQLSQLLTSQPLSNVYLEYLYMFPMSAKSMVSKYETLNEIKVKILNIFYMIFTQQFCDEVLGPINENKYEEFCSINIVSYIFSTFANECTYMESQHWKEDDFVEQIVCKAISVIEKMMDKKAYQAFFIQVKIQVLFALLSYCRTSPQQLQFLYEQPDKFADIAEEFSQSFPASPLVKVRASNLLKTFIKTIDQALSNIVQLCVVFITGSLYPQQQDSQILKLAKQAYSSFSFMNYKSREKLDVSLSILTLLAEPLEKRSDLKSVIVSIFMTNSRTLHSITDELVLCRLIHFIGYFPNSLYFNLIQKLMYNEKIYLLLGLRCFDRIARNKIYLEAFPHMHLVFNGIAELVEVGEPVFEHLIYEHCQTVLRKSFQLYCAVLAKIQSCFRLVVTDMKVSSNKQKAILCLNYLQKLLQSQKNQAFLQALQQTYLRLQPLGLKCPDLQQNYLSIYGSLVKKSITLPPQISSFIVAFSGRQKLKCYSNYSLYFQLANTFVLKTDEDAVLQTVFAEMMEFMAGISTGQFNYGILPQISYLMGQILLSTSTIQPNQKFMQFLVVEYNKKELQKSLLSHNKQWLSFLLLHYIYLNASKMRNLLQQSKQLTTLMLGVFNTKWSTKIQRKVVLMAMLEMVIYEEDAGLRLEILRYCVRVLNDQKIAYFTKGNQNKGKAQLFARPRSNRPHRNQREDRDHEDQMDDGEWREFREQEEERMENEAIKNKDEDLILFKDFKHPFDKVCEFSMFKHKVYSFSSTKQINQQSVPGISQILQYQWHKNTIRRVFKAIKRQQQ